MLNQTVIVGRLVEDPTVKKIKNGNEVTNITLAVPRPYKNVNGEYDKDFISCVLRKDIAKSAVEYCKKGDVLGVKGYLKKLENDKELKLVAEKVTFLSTKRSDKNE